MKLVIVYKNGLQDIFTEKDLDCTSLTLRGHTAALIDAWRSVTGPMVHKIDSCHAVNTDEIVSVYIEV